MKISRLYLKNIRCIEELTIDFPKKNPSALFIGENGDGKSTILKSLAIGLCDQSSASALFRELPGDFIRYGEEDEGGTIEVDLLAGSYIYSIHTTISYHAAFERVEQKLFQQRGKNGEPVEITQDEFPWESIFASGYGAGVRNQGTADFEYYLTVDAVYPLFRYDSPLQNPELMVLRLLRQADKSARASKAKDKVLNVVRSLLVELLDLDEEEQIELTAAGIGIRGRWGFTTMPSLGDGYKSVVTLILDMLSWWFLKQQQEEKEGVPTDLSGIVLIDEIEQHLDPKWQRTIISKLVISFPEVQFITRAC